MAETIAFDTFFDQSQEPDCTDAERDSLHILPLSIVPVTSPALRRARMIKSARLDSVVELFDGVETGSGQVAISNLSKEFGWPEVPPHPDAILLRKLSTLPSFDVFSLRILLRAHGIPVESASALVLSPATVQKLTSYMATFTRPLLEEIYGKGDVNVKSFGDLVALFRNAAAPDVRVRLNQMAEKLGIQVVEIPRFLEDYGDIAMSLSYYRRCLDQIVPAMQIFFDSLTEIRKSHQLRQDGSLMLACSDLESKMNFLMASTTGQMERFDRSTTEMWQDLDADRFRKISAMIRSYHTRIGAVLCALNVKMNAWMKFFPDASGGSVLKKSEFIMSEMKHGIDRISDLEDRAPLVAAQ